MGETALHHRSCEACKGAVAKLADEVQQRLHRQIPDWQIVDGHHLSREFKFKQFLDGLEFVNHIAEVAEEENHHPDIQLSWGKVVVTIFTHKIDGLTEADFILAAKIDFMRPS